MQKKQDIKEFKKLEITLLEQPIIKGGGDPVGLAFNPDLTDFGRVYKGQIREKPDSSLPGSGQ